jgi:hypothetical protein
MADDESGAAECGADSEDEVLIVDASLVVLVEVFEETFVFAGGEYMTVLLENPLEFVAVHFAVTILVELSEESGQVCVTSVSAGIEKASNLFNNLVWGFTLKTEHGVNVRVVA